MTPAVKLMRSMLFLPVREAEERERRVNVVVNNLKQAKEENSRIRTLVSDSADNLHHTYDKLLERTKWGK
ncbi:MAG: hypothetical protein JWN75_1169 [Candidatus Saccharibacteria bacterium]|nr:hypothetical protein [Candidatus Saccharibacteria bacterium]